jgi:phosphatidylserine/phosphatidylglycerophosphate/cardiolipin synthase-like enzyme
MSNTSRAPRRVAWRTALRAVGWLVVPVGVVVVLALAARPDGSPTLIGAAARATPTAHSRRIVRPRPARPPHPTATPRPAPSPTPTPAPTLRLFVGPGSGVWAFVKGISEARHRLLLQVGALADGRIVDALLGARARGVDVRVLYDPSGMDRASLARLQAAGVLARTASPAFAATVQATLVVDSRYTLLATGMLTPFALDGTRSFVVRDLDHLATAEVAAVFYDDWLRRRPSLFVSHLIVAPPQVQTTVGHVIDLAQETLDVSTQQLSDAGVAAALLGAMRRGVEVHLLTSGDMPLGQDVSLVIAGLAVRRLASPVVRGTLIVEDGQRAYLSSVDLSALGQNAERGLGVMINDKPIMRTLGQTFAADWDAASIVQKPPPTPVPCGTKRARACPTPAPRPAAAPTPTSPPP